MNLPLYKAVVQHEEAGVSAVALVDHPAIDIEFLAFEKQTKFEFSVNQEERIVSGALMVADMPIYRNDKGLEYYIMFDAPTIKDIVQRFFKKKNTAEANLMHDGNILDGVYMFESYIVDDKRGNKAPSYAPELPQGSWVGSYKIDNDEVWDKVKSGEVKGFSVEGLFGQVKIADKPKNELEEAHAALSDLADFVAQLTK